MTYGINLIVDEYVVEHIIDLQKPGVFEQLKYDFVNKFNDRRGYKLARSSYFSACTFR
jgi:hypothetical protein